MGKTTILNCVYYILKKQYDELAKVDFWEIIIKFKNSPKISVKLDDIKMYNSRRMTTYRNHNGHLLALITDNFTSKYNDSFDIDETMFVDTVKTFSKIADIPISLSKRIVRDYLETGEYKSNIKDKKGDRKKVEVLNSALDNNVTHKILYLTTYRRIEDDFSQLLHKNERFHEPDMLIRFGMSDVDKAINGILDLIRENSRESFNKMTGVLLKQYAAPQSIAEYDFKGIEIDKAMFKIILDRLGNEIAETDRLNILSLLDSNKIYYSEYAYLLDLVVKLIENYNKQKVYDDKINNFAATCNKYLNGKKFVYNQSELKLEIKLFDGEEETGDIKLPKLSSGEKQIVSLFSKLYLENDKDNMLIIDEPELSLSMRWQKMLLPDIMRSGNCKLLLTVTHSPFIFDNEFDMDAKEMRTCINNKWR